MQAIVVDPSVPGRLSIREVDSPSRQGSEALVAVRAVSLNLGEVRRSMNEAAGWRPGWDIAGTVVEAAADGSGPPAGSRVVALMAASGGWAEQVAVPAHAMATLPDSVSFEQASTLPVAGLTALYALERGGSLLERRVLITGASGGVGHLACQLARHAGAYVVASVRQEARTGTARAAGADEVVAGPDPGEAAKFGPFSLILDSVGGTSLSVALTLLARDGVCVLYGASAGADVTFDARRFYGSGGASLYGFILFHEVLRQPAGAGLSRLVQMQASGVLKAHIDVEAPWTAVADVVQRFMDRQIAGKAVLRVGA